MNEIYFAKLKHWLKEIPDATLSECQYKHFAKGEYIAYKDHDYQNIFLILDGICNVINILDNGTENITLRLTSGDFIGVSEYSLKRISNIATVVTCTDVHAVYIHYTKFQVWLKQYPSFTDFVLQNLVRRLHYTADFSANCKSSISKVNLAKYLIDRYQLELSTHSANMVKKIKIDETHEVIATFLSISPRTLDRQILALKSNDLIQTEKGKITITSEQYQKLLDFVALNL